MKIILLLSLFLSSLMALTSSEIISHYEINFSKEAILEVREINANYIILSSTINFGIDENRKLNLISKSLLLKYLKNTDKKITTIKLKKFKNITQWKTEDRLYLLSYIEKENVISSYHLLKNKGIKSILDKEITLLEQSRNKDVVIHKQLKNLYFQKGDIDNYNREVDILMNEKFNGL